MHDWLDEDLPDNVTVAVAEGVFLHSVYAFSHYRSRAREGVKLGEHMTVYDTTMFDLGP